MKPAFLRFGAKSWPTSEQRLLLQACLRADRTALESWEEWRRRVDFDRIDPASQRLIPLLHHNLHRLGVTGEVMARYQGLHRRDWWKNQQLFHRLAVVLGEFHRAGIRTLLLKGAALADLYYPKPGLRPMHDGDVLIPEAQAFAAIRLLFDRGWKSLDGETRDHVEQQVSLRHSHDFIDPHGCVIDLHWHALYTPLRADADEVFWAAAQKIEVRGVQTLTLSATDHFLHACEHGVPWNATPSIRWIADAMMILNQGDDPVDWRRLLTQTRAWRLPVLMAHACVYLRRHFDAPIPEEVVRTLVSEPAPVGERWEFRAATSAGWIGQGLSYYGFRFRRLHADRTEWRNHSVLAAYARYLKISWKLRTEWQVPAYIFRRLGRHFRRNILGAFRRRNETA